MVKKIILAIYGFWSGVAGAQSSTAVEAPKPLFADPVYDGAADPVIVWHEAEARWYMLYTNRRANVPQLDGVSWVHGTRIGIAVSADGAHWQYLDTANIQYRPHAEYTFWAPEVIAHKGTYHMYLTYVPGIFTDWQHPRHIVHLTSTNLRDWDHARPISLANDKVIDACIVPRPGGGWRMWYNNERDKKSIYYADSDDLYHWNDKGKALAERGEGPKVFGWKGWYWMVIDGWAGLTVLRSRDMDTWQKQAHRLLEQPGIGMDDGAIGGHADVVVAGSKAYLYYFVHPGKSLPQDGPAKRRSVIQVTELTEMDGWLHCNRDVPTRVDLQAAIPNNKASK